MNWSCSLSPGLLSAVLQFNGVGVVGISSNGQAGAVNSNFRQRFNESSTLQRVSLLISKVNTADNKSNGELSCELSDLNGYKWRRVIRVQVIGKLKIFADFSRFTPRITLI